ncbi:helix-turn-helix domain-containing protein [[Clostridium] dakarense]|uniref:helix-turn-helix domain-containing protein n=1 Tax=Faecalimicrobium dakarense TaxID=1301100 RepID=UPI0004BA5FCE|nr:helix-turn-helix transcriptional regulator [[Clostridium] dakarense]
MEFGEKLLDLRKKEGMSQEVLAEKLNTSRQAISKWENGQGFPETEKLLKIGNIFDVSIDYLLKNSVENKEDRKDGYYVSREVAEGFLINETKMAKNALIGISTIVFSYIPYLIFKDRFEIYVIIVSIMVAIGVGFLLKGIMLEDNYKTLKKEALIFDEKVLKDINEKYDNIKNKYNVLAGVGICLICSGLVVLFFLKKDLIIGIDTTGYQIICTFLISVGVCISGYFMSIIEAYRILIKNQDYINKASFKLMKKIKEKI